MCPLQTNNVSQMCPLDFWDLSQINLTYALLSRIQLRCDYALFGGGDQVAGGPEAAGRREENKRRSLVGPLKPILIRP